MRWCLLLALAALAAPAGALERSVELTPFAAYRAGGTFEDRDTGDDFDLNDSSAYGLTLTIPWTDVTDLEIYYSDQSTELDNAGFISGGAPVDLDIQYLQIGGTYLFDRNRNAVPFFAATAGAARIDPKAEGTRSDTFLSFGVGGGWKFFPESRVGLRLEGRLLGTFIDSNSSIFCGSGSQGGSCLIRTSGDVLWQFEAQAGFIVRF